MMPRSKVIERKLRKTRSYQTSSRVTANPATRRRITTAGSLFPRMWAKVKTIQITTPAGSAGAGWGDREPCISGKRPEND